MSDTERYIDLRIVLSYTMAVKFVSEENPVYGPSLFFKDCFKSKAIQK